MNLVVKAIPDKGAALDFIKVFAALLMVVDHVNKMFLGLDPYYDLIGRCVFPLFALITAIHIKRGSDMRSYVETMLPLGMLSQVPYVLAFLDPLYKGALDTVPLNIIFTLAIGGWVASYLRELPIYISYLVFVPIGFYWYAQPHLLFDYGVIGVMLPFAFVHLLDGRRLGWFICLVLLLLVNTSYDVWEGYFFKTPDLYQPVVSHALLIFFSILLGMVGAVVLSRSFVAKERFLPRYALHVFYPFHLFLLWAVVFLQKVELF